MLLRHNLLYLKEGIEETTFSTSEIKFAHIYTFVKENSNISTGWKLFITFRE